MTNNNPISVTYSDEKLRILVEEYITMQRFEFTLKDVCSYILYRAMEEERTANTSLYKNNQLCPEDCVRVSEILKRIIVEQRLTMVEDKNASDVFFADATRFVKAMS